MRFSVFFPSLGIIFLVFPVLMFAGIKLPTSKNIQFLIVLSAGVSPAILLFLG